MTASSKGCRLGWHSSNNRLWDTRGMKYPTNSQRGGKTKKLKLRCQSAACFRPHCREPYSTRCERSFKASQMLSSLNAILNIHPDYFQHLCPACCEKATRDVMETRSLYSRMKESKGVEAMRTSGLGPCKSRASAGSSRRKTLCTSRDAPGEHMAWQDCAMGSESWGGIRVG